ncbi:MAG: trypsin-like peptidase domain-containing protein, partial [Ilumatobacteraceae bacterium]|nr:trypsin-like peptidase domain-containing protein [Ilumatobacteraceae bacterium]
HMAPPPIPWYHFPPPPPMEVAEQTDNARRGRRSRLIRFVAIGVVVSFAAGLIGGVLATQIDSDSSTNTEPYTQVTAAPVVSTDDSAQITGVAAAATRLANSVVTISSLVNGGMGEGESTGTGVVVTSDGEILTNAHVVEGATEVRVRFAGDTEPVTAVVVAADAGNDLALLKVDAQNLVAATFAKPGSVRVGDQVVAIGYALALDGGPSVTTGIVSAMRRTIFTDSGALNSLIQTDAAISSGNSGGPLANMRGEVVGINTAVARGSNNSAANNIGFAISVDEVLTVLEQLREQASGVPRTEGFLGVSLEARNDGGAGSIIATVQPGSPAEQAGVLIGDIVLAVDGEPVNGQAGLVAAIRDRTPGDSISIDLVRDGERLTVSAVLVARPQD